MLQPVLVRPIGDGEYELIAGERRWRAARRVGLQTIPALVRETDDAAALEQALVENLHRDDLNPLEEAAAYQQLIEDFGLTHDEVAARVGRSRATVTNTLRLMQLPPAIQKSVQERQARRWATPGRCSAVPTARSRSSWPSGSSSDDLSVRAIEEAVREHQGERRRGRARRRRRRPTAHRAAPAAPAAGPGRARGAARRPPRDPGEDLDGQRARGKVVVEFSTLEDLERIYRRDHRRRHARTSRTRERSCARNYSQVETSGCGGCSTPRRTPRTTAWATSAPAHDERAHAVDVVGGHRFADDRGHAGLPEHRVGAPGHARARRRGSARARGSPQSATACPASDRKRPDS